MGLFFCEITMESQFDYRAKANLIRLEGWKCAEGDDVVAELHILLARNDLHGA